MGKAHNHTCICKTCPTKSKQTTFPRTQLKYKITRAVLLSIFIIGFAVFVTGQSTVTPSHSASHVKAGAFQAGAYSIPGSLSVGSLSGSGLASCSGSGQKLLYSSATQTFSCGVDATGVVSPTAGSSCVLLGSSATPPSSTIVPAPACMGTLGGCRLLTIGIPTGSGEFGQLPNPVLSEFHFSSIPGSKWVTTGVEGSVTVNGFNQPGGAFSRTGNFATSQPLTNGNPVCRINVDGNGASFSTISLFVAGAQCQFFVCP